MGRSPLVHFHKVVAGVAPSMPSANVSCPLLVGSADSILDRYFFRPAPEFQARIEELAAKSTEGQLTQTEREEYAGYVRANKFIAILKRLARDVGRQAA
jgi:hypothetical protein